VSKKNFQKSFFFFFSTETTTKLANPPPPTPPPPQPKSTPTTTTTATTGKTTTTQTKITTTQVNDICYKCMQPNCKEKPDGSHVERCNFTAGFTCYVIMDGKNIFLTFLPFYRIETLSLIQRVSPI
jgi:hypothetical protein